MRPVSHSRGDLEHNRVTRILRNPRYAGAFFYGRTRFQKKVEGGDRSRDLPRKEWHTLILDAHPAYVTWRDYEENLRRLQENAQTQGIDRSNAQFTALSHRGRLIALERNLVNQTLRRNDDICI